MAEEDTANEVYYELLSILGPDLAPAMVLASGCLSRAVASY